MCFIFLIAAIQLNAALKISIPLQSHSKLTAGRTLASCLSFKFWIQNSKNDVIVDITFLRSTMVVSTLEINKIGKDQKIYF